MQAGGAHGWKQTFHHSERAVCINCVSSEVMKDGSRDVVEVRKQEKRKKLKPNRTSTVGKGNRETVRIRGKWHLNWNAFHISELSSVQVSWIFYSSGKVPPLWRKRRDLKHATVFGCAM